MERDSWRHRYAVLVCGATFLLVIAGGLVTSTGSGLAVPDWPLSFGQVFPRMEGGVLFEHGHRLVAASVGLLTVVLAAWTARAEPRPWVRLLGWTMLGTVVLQGVLGGVTVLMRLPTAVSVSHAGLAQVFFSLTMVMAAVTAPGFTSGGATAPDAGMVRTRTLAIVTVVAVYLQILLGAVVRHLGVGLIIPDFPLSYGRLLPPFDPPLVAWHSAHRVGAVVVTALAAWTVTRSLRLARGRPELRPLAAPALALALLVACQVTLGALTIWKQKAVTPTTAHVATGGLVLVTAVLLAVRAHRLLRSNAAEQVAMTSEAVAR